MKEIKFRFYSRHFEKIVEIDEIDFKKNMVSYDTRVTKIGCKGLYIGYKNQCEYINHPNDLMQYTGLKDKNGKEIYEGDIVIFKEFYGEEPEIEMGIIEFNEGMFFISFFNNTFENLKEIDIEVIGNIHENPELLENKI